MYWNGFTKGSGRDLPVRNTHQAGKGLLHRIRRGLLLRLQGFLWDVLHLERAPQQFLIDPYHLQDDLPHRLDRLPLPRTSLLNDMAQARIRKMKRLHQGL